jgi:hypothetical protein
VLQERWSSLPAELQTNNQISGRHLTHCGFTLGASYCSFHCTHCYLPKNANSVVIPSLAQVKEQIAANRRFQGPGGGLQITGDVADAYWKAGRECRSGSGGACAPEFCVFRGAVKRNGEWMAVPMCSMNQHTWSEVYDTRLRDPELLKELQVFAMKESASELAPA